MTNHPENLEIPYIQEYEFKSVDLNKLRPGKSYDELIRNRNYLLDSISKFGGIPESLLEVLNCPLCNSLDYTPEMKKDSLQIVKCVSCELVYVNPRLSASAYYDSYRSEAYGHIIDNLTLTSHEYRLKRFGYERIEQIENFHDISLEKKVLEIGSASGFFIEAAQNRGWKATGIELSSVAVEFSRKRGLEILSVPLEEIDFKGEKFSAVVMFDVLEHLPNLSSTMSIINEILSEKGLLYIYVPNWNSASRLLIEEDAHFIWPSHHLTYFTPITISKLLSKFDMNILKLETNGLDFEDWLWKLENTESIDVSWLRSFTNRLQFLANSAGWGKNLRVLARKRSN